MNAELTRAELACPACGACQVLTWGEAAACACGFRFIFRGQVLDLYSQDPPPDTTSEHYSLQWGPTTSFLKWLREHPEAKEFMPSYQLGWYSLFDRIIAQAQDQRQPVWVHDAACGYGGLLNELLTRDAAPGLRYIGADIHDALPMVAQGLPTLEGHGRLVRWDITQPLPLSLKFDYVLCRSAIMHTPDPPATLRTLASLVKPGGRLAISVYNRKPPAREALDDLFRAQITQMPAEEALRVCHQFTLLGKYLQAVAAPVNIEEDLPLFGIAKGTYKVQSLFYNHFLKCWHNQIFGDSYSDLVNFDWYHPPYAFRYTLQEIEGWFTGTGLAVLEHMSNEAQHFLLAG